MDGESETEIVNKEKKMKTHAAICQIWVESEHGWGVRPDGYSLHLSKSDAILYAERYWDSMPYEIQHVYSRPYQEPYWIMIDDETYEQLKVNGKFGMRMPGPAPKWDNMEVVMAEIQNLINFGDITGESFTEHGMSRLQEVLASLKK